MILPDLIIETTIRDGLAYLKQNPAVVDDIFSEMTQGYADRKYGAGEIAKIKAVLAAKTVAVVHSFHEAAAKSPCYSIQLGSENEAKDRAHLSDHEEDIQVPITDSGELAALVRVADLVPTAYDPLSGKVSVSDDADMTQVYRQFVYVDGSGAEFVLQPGISNVPGNKFFFIPPGSAPNIAQAGYIRTFLDYTQHEEKGDVSNVNILVGCHAKDALLTKYLYVILKYIMKSRKRDLIQRDFTNSTFQGSDFTRDLKYEGDMVFTRFFTVSGQVEDSWTSDDVELIDSVEIDAEPVDDEGDEPDSDDP